MAWRADVGRGWPAFGLWVPLLVAQAGLGAETAGRAWDPAVLRDPAAWPPVTADTRLLATPRGLRVEVTANHTFAIAAVNDLELPTGCGQVRVRTAEVGGGATWFVRLYGEVRRPGERRTIAVAQGETAVGERVFDLDPRWRQGPGAPPLQVQLGVEGAPGAFVLFDDAAFLPAPLRANRVATRTVRQPGQLDLAAVELMPNLPEPFDLADWRQKALDYDRFVFDFQARGEYLPLVWLDDSHVNLDRPTFGLPSYVGDPRRGPGQNGAQEGVTCLGAVLGATLVGVDKSRQEHDYVGMCEAWFNSANGQNLVLNLQRQGTGGSFWYELFPHVVFYALADRHQGRPRLGEIMRTTADRWREACASLTGPDGLPDFDHTAYDFAARRPVDNGQWKEPDAAAGVAWLQYAAWTRFGDAGYLESADRCVSALERRPDNPYYEVLLPFGVLVAARLNAEHGKAHDVGRLLEWCFGVSDCRGGWGVTVGTWGGYDCDGLVGSIDNRGGYAFAMNTFVQAGALLPVARYDSRYARAIGKWLLNLANSARLFYPGALPAEHQTSGAWTGDPRHVIAYEGLRREWQGRSPCATGDPVAMNWGPKTDLGLYGSSYVGWLGAVVRPTDVPGLLQLDCLATDFCRGPAYPTHLCYNPYPEERRFRFAAGPEPVDLYDAVTDTVLARGVQGATGLTLAADSAALVVALPAAGRLTRDGTHTRLGDVVVRYR